MRRKRIILLGATGSIGKGTLEVVRENSDVFKIAAVSAHSSMDKLKSIAEEFSVPVTALAGNNINSNSADFTGKSGLIRMIRETEADIVVNGIAGSDGLMSSVAAIESGKNLALANKETIVMAGDLIMAHAKKFSRKIIPVDSEHSAVFRLLESTDQSSVTQIILTASGGPFRKTPIEEFSRITLEDALKHPTWDMGRKITIDSATMANKGLEVIEAHKLFSMPGDSIKVLIHPQSMVHSLIRTKDASMYAQISTPDMRIPIGNALYYPDIMISPFGKLELGGISLEFEDPDFRRFPMLKIAYDAIEAGGSYPIAYNAVNEIAVDFFINREIGYNDIAGISEAVMNLNWTQVPGDFAEVMEIDLKVRKASLDYMNTRIRKL